ncbi:MAG TPA: sugar ABC transporter permease, partial [Caldithrix abyssi]|nr:sugar ABC transporter permease [Caldithrix abyssi]
MKKSVRKLSVFEKFLAYGVLIFFSLFSIYPILVVFSISLRPGDRLLSKSLAIIPENFTF